MEGPQPSASCPRATKAKVSPSPQGGEKKRPFKPKGASIVAHFSTEGSVENAVANGIRAPG